MSPFKGLMMFQFGVGPYGWGESLWINKPTFEAGLAVLEELAAKRIALSPPGISIVGLRVTNPDIYRASRVSNLRLEGTFQSEKGLDFHSNSLLVRFAGGNYYTNYNLGGLPRGMHRQMGLQATREWQRLFQGYAEAIKEHCVIVNLRHLRKGEERPADAPDTVINPIQEVMPVRVALKRRGIGPVYMPRGRARNRRRG
jgi:hypothetical protein